MFTVTAYLVPTNKPESEPVAMPYAHNVDELGVMHAVACILRNSDEYTTVHHITINKEN